MVKVTVLVDGYVIETWGRIKRKAGTLINVHLFKKLSGAEKKSVELKFSSTPDTLESRPL